MGGLTSEGNFKNSLGIDVFYILWETEKAIANVVFCHGPDEHVSRYRGIFDKFASQGIQVLAFDQVGHGRTPSGAKGVVEDEQVLLDITLAAELICQDGIPLFLMGHSFGGLAAFNYLSRGEKRELVHGTIASAPAMGLSWAMPSLFLRILLVIFSFIVPWMKENARTDESTVEDNAGDILSALKIRDVMAGGKKIISKGCNKICAPNMLIVHGTEDGLASFGASATLAEKLKRHSYILNLQIKTCRGSYSKHIFEDESDELICYFIDWIIANIPANQSNNPQ
ncbi:hypothetical protein DSO57_1009678 [Entomophthora muscae]|uniref:Uncharacterized protein n=1 Tax=Entomophthora muscae TaxID=34485 RepID=A0ACC2THU1_9FUNG|nr:hypothetical protein DSO57_1009678 [Entomophthora muscae]